MLNPKWSPEGKAIDVFVYVWMEAAPGCTSDVLSDTSESMVVFFDESVDLRVATLNSRPLVF